MKRILIFLALMAMHIYAFAAPVSESVAREKAVRFLQTKAGTASLARQAQRLGDSPAGTGGSLTAAEVGEAYYVFNIDSGGGYVIVSGDDRMPDVLGYSYSGTYDAAAVPENMRAWLEGYAAEYEQLQARSAVRGASVTAVGGNVVYPLLDCKWDQGAPYSDRCPIVRGAKSWTGCIATAMAQILYYHQSPSQTTKAIPSYVTTTYSVTIPEIGITAIDWQNITPRYSAQSSEAENDAVSTLMLLCGCASKTNYMMGGASANIERAQQAFEYFGYSGMSTILRKNYDENTWTQTIYDEIKSGRPVLYSAQGSRVGHAFVIDGYDANNYFHVNWGASGRLNGYFLLTGLTFAEYGDLHSDHKALIGIQGPGNTAHRYAYAELNGETMTFYYDDNRESRTGKLFIDIEDFDWTQDSYKNSIKYIRFDPTFKDYKYNGISTASEMFAGLSNLVSVEGLEYVNARYFEDTSSMFSGCSKLTSVTLPEGVTSIGESAFSGCSNLTSVRIPNSVTSIGEAAFYDCYSLTTVRIPAGVKKIDDYAFYDCHRLTDVYCYAETRPFTGSYVFYSTSSATLHVPGTSVDNYRWNSPWSSFRNVVALTADYYDYSRNMTTLEDRAEWTEVIASVPNAVAFVEYEQEPWAKSQTNVAVEGGNGYYCPNFILTDFSQHAGTDYEKTGFYTPYAFTVNNGTYKRQAYSGYNTIYVPFSFNASELSATARLYAFDRYDENGNKAIFKRVKQTVEPGTPCIVKEPGDIVWDVDLTGKTISASDPREFGYMRGTYVTTDTYQGNGYSPNYDNEFAPLSQYLHPFRACFVTDSATRAAGTRIALDDDITDINEIKAGEQLRQNDGKHLENGRMVIYKNGRKYNINGAIMK